jgi:hypothetical protein
MRSGFWVTGYRTTMAPVMRSSRYVVVWLAVAACVPNEKGRPGGDAGPPGTPAPATARPRPATNAPRPVAAQPIRLREARGLGTDAAGTRSAPSLAAPSDATPVEALRQSSTRLREPFRDSFERADLGSHWRVTSSVWRIQGGQLCGRGAKNHPAWLAHELPTNARIEFDAVSKDPEGDIKVEVWGDGKSFAKATSYTDASSYIVIFGGWKNTYHVLARIDEHAPGRPEVRIDPSGADHRASPVRAGQTYHFKIERSDGKTVRWLVDDIEIISFSDPQPLKGPGHDHFGFNDWDVPVCFDNLVVVPLSGS